MDTATSSFILQNLPILRDLNHWKYNSLDVVYTFECYKVLSTIIKGKSTRLQEFHNFQQIEANKIASILSKRGVRIDLEEKSRLTNQFSNILETIKTTLTSIVGETFNPKSPKQLEVLFTKILDIVPKSNKLGNPSFDYSNMLEYSIEYPLYKPLILLILEYRSISIFLKNFLQAEVEVDGRIYSAYSVAGTATFRFASRKNVYGRGANLQTIPEQGKLDLHYTEELLVSTIETETNNFTDEIIGITKLPNCKTMFLPDPGYILANVDYDSADARIVAWDSGAAWLMNYFSTSQEKLYIYIAQMYLQRTITTDDPWYLKFKRFIHGSHYGASAGKMAITLGITLAEATRIQKWYFKLNPEIPQWHHRLISTAKAEGYIENVFGGRRNFYNKKDPKIAPQVYAFIPSSVIAILVNIGIVNLNKIANFQLLLQTHDSATLQFPMAIPLAIATTMIKKSMEVEIPYPKPLIIPSDIKFSTTNYGELKKLESPKI
ncbi:MAG: DNA polymerase [Burkholderiales bacterium]